MNYEDGEVDDGEEPLLGLDSDPFGDQTEDGVPAGGSKSKGGAAASGRRHSTVGSEEGLELNEDDFGFGFLESTEYSTAMSKYAVEEEAVPQYESPTHFHDVYPEMIVCMAVAGGGKVVFTATEDAIKLWSVSDKKLLRTVYTTKAGHITLCATNASGKHVVFSEKRQDDFGKHKLVVFDGTNPTAPPKIVEEPHGSSEVTCCSVNTAGNHFVTGAMNHTICLWSTTDVSSSLCEFEGHLGSINSLEFVFGDVVVSSCTNGDLCLWNMSSMELVNELPGHPAFLQPWKTWVLPSG